MATERSAYLLRHATVALAAMPLLGMRPMVVLLALWTVIALWHRIERQVAVVARPELRTWTVLALPMLLMLIDLLRAPDALEARTLVERSAALALVPGVFLLIGAPSDPRTQYRMMDVLAVTALLFTLGVNALMPWGTLGDPWHPGFDAAYREAFAGVSGTHPPYAAYWMLAGALFQIGRSGQAGTQRAARWVLTTVLLLGALLIGSRMPVLAFTVAASWMVLRRPGRDLRWLLLPVTVGALVLCAPVMRERADEVTGVFAGHAGGSVAERGPLMRCAVEVLEEHWIAGVGQAALQPAMDMCLGENGRPDLADGAHGPHCQPITWWASLGLAGLVAYVLLFMTGMRAARRTGNDAAFAFLLFLLLCSLTEDLLTRQWGVVLFATFNSVFVAEAVRRK